MTTLHLKQSISRSPSRLALLLISLVFACFTLPERAQAVVPPPDGGYPGGNTAEGNQALFNLNGGLYNTANGAQALYWNTTGNSNTATGYRSLFNVTTGANNTATGFQALFRNLDTGESTATGYQALYNNTGCCNTATGSQAMFNNTAGAMNTATGWRALFRNSSGGFNTADGIEALRNNSIGESNTATGFQALYTNTRGNFNTANAFNALYSNTIGSNNTAVGEGALYSNTTGSNNTAVGIGALSTNTTGNNNIGIGTDAGQYLFTGSNNIYIGSVGNDESNTIRIGLVQTQTVIAGIHGATVTGGASPVYVNSFGYLGTFPSSVRFKDEIKPMDGGSEVILALKPVSFYYKKEIDPKRIPQFGLVAEEVEKVQPDLITRDADGKPYTVRYEAVNAMVLNEFIKAHRKIEEQGARIAQQQKQIDALTAGLQKVSAQLEASKPAPQVVYNP